jgi:uncharacterized protein (TIGR02996 family)
MSIPPAHRRLVPRRPRPPEAPEAPEAPDEPEELDELDATVRRPAFDPEVLDLGDGDSPAPRDSMALTLDRERPDTEEDQTHVLRQLADAAAEADAHAPGAGASFSDLEATLLHGSVETSGIEARPTAHLSPAEYGLLAAIAEGHEPSRLRYADWLERRGEHARAELLRLDHALHAMSASDPRFIPTLQRIRALAPRVSVDWRSRVSRAAIEGCAAYGVTCPMYWRALPPDADDVRTCTACGDRVYYCVTIQLAQERVQQSQCVALDLACERWPGDLDRQCDGCSGHVPPQTRFCPHCGRAMPRARSLG